MSLTVAIVGRPNVGKSTLFNRLAGKRLAIVDDTPGVTRDRAVTESNVLGLELRLIDTAGFDKGAAESLTARMAVQTLAAIKDADVCLFVIDARTGLTAGDRIVADALRKSGKPVIVAANKSESAAADAGNMEAYALGFGEPVAVSAEHALGIGELRDALAPYYAAQFPAGDSAIEPEEPEAGNRPLRLAIVGRPNVGKSSLLNRLIGEERALTSPEAGTTRDAVLAEWQHEGRDIVLHDTAGLRRKARVEEKLERLSVGSTLNAVRFADCVILVMDAADALEKQDLTIADMIAREGRALVFAVNKWDLVKDRNAAFKTLRERVDRLLPQIAGAPIVGLSALTGEGMDRLMPAVLDAERIWNMRVSTGALNRFLEGALERHPPPAIKGRRVRIRYMTQAKARPPTFVLFGSQLKELPESYLRYLVHAMRTAFKMPGTPVRVNLRSAKNPYAD
ncbi:MAG TPA: ribosome biogenesis GTPase Der [Micropepsaceae bacterium]|nr:ribosome biogenesis GTPase Der [Micropepsaceae bacterium]